MSAARSLEEYLDLAYSISLTRAEDGEWVATVDELAGCEARGASPDEAAARVQEAMGDWIATALEENRAVPTPRAELSGRLLVRMPKTLHADLARAAAREQVSLNQFITGALSTAVTWRGEPAGTPAPAPPAEPAQQPKLLRYALIADAVLIAIAAVVAVIVLLAGG